MKACVMKEGLISIIIPVYNVEEYVEKCLMSLLNQTYSNIEIICVDDGSVDGSRRVLETCAEHDSRIKILHQENRGVSSARNLGLDHMQGEFFAFVDPDDYVELDMYEKLITAINKAQADIASCSYCIEKKDKTNYLQNRLHVTEKTVNAKKFFKYIYKRDSYKAVGGYVWTRLFRRTSFEKHDIRFDEDIQYGEGTLFLARCMVKAKKVIYINSTLYHYIQREESAVHNNSRVVNNMWTLNAYERILTILKQHHVKWNIRIWVKRFYVYHASKLLDYSRGLETHEKEDRIKAEIRRYLPEYIITNIRYPSRIIRILNMLK